MNFSTKDWKIYTVPVYRVAVGDFALDSRTGLVVEVRVKNWGAEPGRGPSWAVLDLVLNVVYNVWESDLSDPLTPLEVLAHMAVE